LSINTVENGAKNKRKMEKFFQILFIFSAVSIYASQSLPADSLWNYDRMEIKTEYHGKRDSIILLVKDQRYDILKLLSNDPATSIYMTCGERFLLKAIILGKDFFTQQTEIDTLFAVSRITPEVRNKFDLSPHMRLQYSKAFEDELVDFLYEKFNSVIKSLKKRGEIDDEFVDFYQIVFPVSQQNVIETAKKVASYVKRYPKTKKSELLYDFYYKLGEWNHSGFSFGTGLGYHTFNENGSEYFEPGIAWHMVYFDIIMKGVVLKGGVNFTGHTNMKEINWKGYYIPENNSLNFSEYYVGGGYIASIKERVFILPYIAYTRVKNNLSSKRVKSLGIDPDYPRLNALKMGTTLYFNIQKKEKLKNMYERSYPLLTLDLWCDKYNLEHFGIDKPVMKYAFMIGFSLLTGDKKKNKIENNSSKSKLKLVK
jgi:hypothetical protein